MALYPTEQLIRPHIAGTRSVGLWLLLTSVVGAVASGLLMHERIQLWQDADYTTACDINPWVSCGLVMDSWQASSFGFPNIFLGVIGFPMAILVAVTILGRVQLPRWYWIGLQAGVSFAMLFCIWLWSQAVFVIGALCPYCMVVWAAVIPMFVIVTTRNIATGVLPVGPGLKKLSADWWWVVIVLIYLVVAGSIIVQFPQVFTG
ncbi:membrane protein [Nesterenkonia sp. AN1]|uniref:Putative membrane protein n=1 Tax=Nesterenkonia aurantiaca TaxID=1436010 RepID=A0A4R7G0S5_9MICC|nr:MULTISPECIES: vitamin K epoxide reductase family protein [Nesterenkonia]EXF24938.1 membrane protein [Nesterenkonia sp. AN1]TDS84707.1 putative membrane protein [Nesterenkonia aurantiaca]